MPDDNIVRIATALERIADRLDAGKPEKKYAKHRPVDPEVETVRGSYPCVGGTEYLLPLSKYREWDKTYGKTLDVGTELMNARQWLRDKDTRLKTAHGMPKFLGNWLRRALNGGRGAPPLTAYERKTLNEKMDRAAAADKALARKEAQARTRSPSDNPEPQAVGDLLGGARTVQIKEDE